ncbi:MAG TPA: ribulokinase [Lacunisphaera sp.]|jgi:L-ribulokinase|nr:ribulokinase [Lacunisphaera sp.]HQY05120.1 ribulokinase [Lacunisphaera sp.]
MAIVAGIDFGTLSVRVSLIDSERGRLASASASYPLLRRKEVPDYAAQRAEDYLTALTVAMRDALATAGLTGDEVVALAVDTTGSTIVPVDHALQPLDDYYLWCDHRSAQEAAEITHRARLENLPALRWYGGVYSSEMALAKVLHWLRHNPEKRARFATALEHCDWMVAQLTGVSDVAGLTRSICAAGHKWLWNAEAGGWPADDFLRTVDPLLGGFAAGAGTHFATSDRIAGRLCRAWAERLGLREGIPIPAPALDAHWDAIGAGIALGDVVNVVGTSTCVMAIVGATEPIDGVFGVVPGSIHPAYYGIEAGLSAAGDIFEAIARRAGTTVAALSRGLETFSAGQTGLLRLVWDNGDRNVLSDPALSGITLGWRLLHTAQDELFAAIEGTAFHTRIILERMADNGVPINRVINGGGIPQKNAALNQVYANVFNKPVLVPEQEITSLGSAIFAFLAAGIFSSVEEAQRRLCPAYRVITPEPAAVAVYERLYALYCDLYFSTAGSASPNGGIPQVLRELGDIARVR